VTRPQKILVCGSRGWPGVFRIHARLDLLENALLIVGGAPGPDEVARQWAVSRGVDHIVFYANWERDGKRAGILRNLRMLALKPNLVIAFWDGESRGTEHTITTAEMRGIPVELIR